MHKAWLFLALNLGGTEGINRIEPKQKSFQFLLLWLFTRPALLLSIEEAESQFDTGSLASTLEEKKLHQTRCDWDGSKTLAGCAYL